MRISRRHPIGLLLTVAALLLAGCGDDGGSEPRALSATAWRERANGFCGDAIQEATALPLPGSAAELGPDAAARADIVANVHDSLLTLGQPEGISPDDLGAYVDDLNADVELLTRISNAASSGDDTRKLIAQLDESAGQLAGQLGIDECAALANAIARTP